MSENRIYKLQNIMCCRMLYSRAGSVAGAFGCLSTRLWMRE